MLRKYESDLVIEWEEFLNYEKLLLFDCIYCSSFKKGFDLYL